MPPIGCGGIIGTDCRAGIKFIRSWSMSIPSQPSPKGLKWRTDTASAESRAIRAAADEARRLDAVRGEWLSRGMEPPTLGGIPVSVELARIMGLLPAKE